jgi:hypothetical protein
MLAECDVIRRQRHVADKDRRVRSKIREGATRTFIKRLTKIYEKYCKRIFI